MTITCNKTGFDENCKWYGMQSTTENVLIGSMQLWLYIIYKLTSQTRTVHALHTKAGRFVGLADCYAAIVLADNATFSLAVNRMVTFLPQSSNRWHYVKLISCCRGSSGTASAHWAWGREFEPHLRQCFFHIFAPTSIYLVGAELSSLGFGWEGNSDTAQPYIIATFISQFLRFIIC